MVAARSCEYTCAWKVIRFTHMRQLHKPRLHFFTAPRKLLHHLPRLEPAYTVPVRLVSNLLAHGFPFFGAPPASDNGCLLFALLCTVVLDAGDPSTLLGQALRPHFLHSTLEHTLADVFALADRSCYYRFLMRTCQALSGHSTRSTVRHHSVRSPVRQWTKSVSAVHAP